MICDICNHDPCKTPIFCEECRKHDGKGNGHDHPRQSIAVYTADTLQFQKFPPLQHIVPGILFEGVTLLAGRPKVGKSWKLLHEAVAVASNGYTLGSLKCTEGDVLYCALEDSARRMHGRLDKIQVGWPHRLYLVHQMPRLSDGGLDFITAWLTSHPEARLVQIDTLQMIRDRQHADGPLYQGDYDALVGLRQIAADRHVAIEISHHTRKAEADDVFDTVSGTLGLTGAADAIMILKGDGNGGGTLYAKGRDFEDYEKPLSFDRGNCKWIIVGEGEDANTPEGAILAALRHQPSSAQQVADLLKMPPRTVRHHFAKLRQEGRIQETARRRGTYQVVDNTQ